METIVYDYKFGNITFTRNNSNDFVIYDAT